MRLHAQKLKALAEKSGVTSEQLASAIERTGLEGKRAESAIGNWLEGRDHPRCKAADINRLAEAVGAQPKDIASFTSSVVHHRGSPLKARLLADLVRGKPVVEAENLLSFSPKRAAVNVRKALRAAVTEAQLAGASEETLYVSRTTVDAGKHIKRFHPKDRGRAHPILKRTSHISLSVEER